LKRKKSTTDSYFINKQVLPKSDLKPLFYVITELIKEKLQLRIPGANNLFGFILEGF